MPVATLALRLWAGSRKHRRWRACGLLEPGQPGIGPGVQRSTTRMQPLFLWALLAAAGSLCAQTTEPTSRPAAADLGHNLAVAPELVGRPVRQVRIVGNRQVPSAVILNVVRTREGDRFEPQAVQEDYQRIFQLKKFANVEARVEPEADGVAVVFEVIEQNQLRAVRFVNNVHISTDDLSQVVDLKEGEAVDSFRISLARQAIVRLYRDRNYPYAHVEIPPQPLAQNGELIFRIVEGPEVDIRKVDFIGNKSFSAGRLKSEIKTGSYFIIFSPGTYDADQIEDDVASLRRFYEQKGFFDVRVGRKLIFSKDQTELQVTFLIEEGPRYTVQRVRFEGNRAVSDTMLRENLKLQEGSYFDQEVMQRDLRQIVKAYSPLGYIYQPQSNNPDYLRIDTRTVFRKEAGQVELVYDIHEGKTFKLGRIVVKGNARTQDKLVLREMRVNPGELYNSAELADAADRLRGTPFYSNVNMTPIGDDPNTRDLLVEVTEGKTATFNIGAAVSSNGGVGGDFTYQQKNFDIGNPPASLGDIFSDRSFTGAGQDLRISFQPSTLGTSADIRFTEPWLFDQPYSFSNDLYLHDRIREYWNENRFGDRVTLGKRFDYVWSAWISLRGEDVSIRKIEDKPLRAFEIVDSEGHHTLTSAALTLRRDTTNHGPLLYRGSNTTVGWEPVGALGGQYFFQKFSLGWDGYTTIGEDLLDRKTVLGLHVNTGYITGGTAPFFERYYLGGFGSVRGFKYRGISPRDGIDLDPIGGNFFTTATAEVNYPIYADVLRGVVFVDAGDVEDSLRFGTVRTSAGAGIRLALPFLGQAPLAIDLAFPINKGQDDIGQVISFSFGLIY